MNDNDQIKLGFTYKDKITGFTGIAIGFVNYISGCNQVLLAPKCDAEGKSPDARWIDVQRLGLDTSAEAITLDNSKTPGADQSAPIR